MAKGKKATVLIAEDDPQILALVADRLGRLGYTVFETSDGDQALSLAREKKPDAVVLDVMMPGRSGWEVCRSIREDDALAGTAIVMLTGIGERLNEMTSPLYGADDYLDKPFDFSDLERKLKSAIQRRRKG